MLISLHVKNLAIIDEVEIDFRRHLNILTGETGAGKSIIIGSINMALGGKASAEMIRAGAEYGLIELVFDMEQDAIYEKMRELELPVEDRQIILSRKLMKNRSVCRVNGEIVTLGILRELAGYLIDIHGQHEHQSLLYKHKHMEILDRYCRNELEEMLDSLSKCYKEYKRAKVEYEEKNISPDERARQISYTEYEMKEIEQANLKVGEDEELAMLYRRFSNAQQIAESLQLVHQITSGEGTSLDSQLGRATKQMYKIAEYDEKIQGMLGQLQNVEELVQDFNYELQDYMSEMEYDERRFREVEERLNTYHSLKAKYGNTVEEILDYYAQLEQKMEQLKEFDLYLDKLRERMTKKEKTYLKLAEQISKIRRDKGQVLTAEIKQALLDLNFLDVKFEVEHRRLESFTERGIDEIEFMISTNPGESVRPLGKVASGGELSRIMLAVKSVIAQQDEIETLIFDEIDVGISGRTAQKVSEKMAVIAKQHQVICITHLPQIAAMADEHYIIEKSVTKDKTTTGVRHLDEQGSVEEIARILGGAQITDTVRKSANEMKNMARQMKKQS